MRLTKEARRAMPGARDWLRAHAPYEAEIVDALNDREVIDDIERYRPGGWEALESGTFVPTPAQRERLSIPD